jgi:AAA15 family ATPase/GTPase
MLESLHIQNFRLFRDFQIEELARVNLIVGKNNVGKSSLLEAINLLVRQHGSQELRDTLFDMLQQRGQTLEQGRLYLLNHLFFNHKFEAETPIHLRSNGFALQIRAQPDKNQLVLEPGSAQTVKIEGVKANGHYKIGMQPGYPPALESVNVHYLTTGSADKSYLRWLWDQIQLTAKEEDVVELLQIVDAQVERIAFLASGPEVMVKLKNAAPLPLGSLGDGMGRLLGIGMGLVTVADGYLLVDEIDTGLHYRVMTDMWRVVLETAVRLNVQVFATTHSWDCIRSFAEALDMIDDKSVGALFRLQRRDEEIQAVRYEADRIAFAIQQEIEIR